jgi:probable HAF family extracellular repeat protein
MMWQDDWMKDLGVLGEGVPEPKAISDIGQVAGDENPAGEYGNNVTYYACLWQAGRRLQRLGGKGSHATALNNKGQVVGWAETATGEHQAFLWRDEVGMKDIGTVYGGFSYAHSINGLGQVVGRTASPDDVQKLKKWLSTGPHDPSEASPSLIGLPFLYHNGTMIDLNTTIDPALGWKLWNAATAINDSGQIVADGINEERLLSHALLLTPIP